MTGSPCQGRNCAAASTAVVAFFGSRGKVELAADDVRRQSGVSCVPGHDTPSGGLTVGAVEAVLHGHGIAIDYGPGNSLRRWTTADLEQRLGSFDAAIVLGLYSNVDDPWRASGSSFRGGHSVVAHDYREDQADSHFKVIQPTYCWHDPLRPRAIRVPASVVTRYSQAPGELKGYAGFVRIPALSGAQYATPMLDRTRVLYDAGAAVHSTRTTGSGSTLYVLKPRGRLVEIAMYAKGEEYRGSREWGALSLLGDQWIHLKRLNHVRGST